MCRIGFAVVLSVSLFTSQHIADAQQPGNGHLWENLEAALVGAGVPSWC
jgi:hypothetical protein